MSLSYKLEKFEGPLDLLLSLIEKNKIDIYDIPISSITGQYLAYVNKLEVEDLELASEFLVMAATLIDLKARLLLPREIDEETKEEIDPRKELVERLIEYKKYKNIAKELYNMYEEAKEFVSKDASIPKEVLLYKPEVDLVELFKDVKIDDIKNVFSMLLKRSEARIDKERIGFGEIKKEEISLATCLSNVFKNTKRNKNISFNSLFKEKVSKIEKVVTFLAILELMKIGCIKIEQEKNFEEINILFNSDVDIENVDISSLGGYDG